MSHLSRFEHKELNLRDLTHSILWFPIFPMKTANFKVHVYAYQSLDTPKYVINNIK